VTEPISERRWNELQTLAWSPVFRPPEGTPDRERHDALRDAVGEAKRLRGLARNNWMAHRALAEILAEHHVMMQVGEFGGIPKLLTDLMQWSAVTVESETCWLREELDRVRAEQAKLDSHGLPMLSEQDEIVLRHLDGTEKRLRITEVKDARPGSMTVAAEPIASRADLEREAGERGDE
jgi:hypothetical protein